MKKLTLLFILICGTSIYCQKPNSNHKPNTYLFVHGAWGGGWEYHQVDSLLRASGDIAYHPTLTGLGERVHLANENIDLNTHINDIVNVFLYENLTNVILVGHSYGGMVITGVAEKIPERIKKMVYLDAFLPNNGESLFTSRGEVGSKMTASFTKNGFVSYPFGPTSPTPPNDVPHPLKTFQEKLKINNIYVKNIPSHYILMTDGAEIGKAGFIKYYERAKQRGFGLTTLPGGHYAMRSQPAKLVSVLKSLN